MSNIPTPIVDKCARSIGQLIYSTVRGFCGLVESSEQADKILDDARDLERRLVEANEDIKQFREKNFWFDSYMSVKAERNTLRDELSQYKTYADSEIALLKTNLEEGIREHERMATSLAEYEKPIVGGDKTCELPEFQTSICAQCGEYTADCTCVASKLSVYQQENVQLKQALSHYVNHPPPHGTDWKELKKQNTTLLAACKQYNEAVAQVLLDGGWNDTNSGQFVKAQQDGYIAINGMKEILCVQCGIPAAFPNIVGEPFTCITCQQKSKAILAHATQLTKEGKVETCNDCNGEGLVGGITCSYCNGTGGIKP